jgi:hypothetical protein
MPFGAILAKRLTHWSSLSKSIFKAGDNNAEDIVLTSQIHGDKLEFLVAVSKTGWAS